jgi:hypothetical protein
LLDLTEQGYTPSLHEVRSLSGYSYPLLRSIERLYGDAWEVRPAFNFNGLGTGGRIVRGRELDLLNVGWVLARGEPLEAGQIEVARREEVRLYRRPTARPYAFAGDREAIAERSPNRIRLQVRLPAPETLVVSEAWMPGWRASLDGQPAAVTPFEGALLSVRVPEGEHAVEFVYDSAFSRVGGWVSLLSASAVLVALALLLARKRRSSPAVAAPAGG